MFHVFLEGGREDDHIFDIHKTRTPVVTGEKDVESSLERRRRVAQTEGHTLVLPCSAVAREGRLFLILLG